MVVFIIALELIVLALLISMIYAVGQLGKEYRTKIYKIMTNMAFLENRIENLNGRMDTLTGDYEFDNEEE